MSGENVKVQKVEKQEDGTMSVLVEDETVVELLHQDGGLWMDGDQLGLTLKGQD